VGVVTQNFSARSARALFQKNPPSLIPGSASVIVTPIIITVNPATVFL